MDSLSWWRVWTYIFDPLPENIKNAKIGSDGPTLDEKLAQLRVFEYCFYAAFSCLWASLILSFGAYFVEARHFHFGGSNFLFEHKRHMQLYRLIQALKIVALLITIAASITWVVYIKTQYSNYLILAAPLMRALNLDEYFCSAEGFDVCRGLYFFVTLWVFTTPWLYIEWHLAKI